MAVLQSENTARVRNVVVDSRGRVSLFPFIALLVHRSRNVGREKTAGAHFLS